MFDDIVNVFSRIDKDSTILVYGDYDADGLMAASVWKHQLKTLAYRNVSIMPYVLRSHSLEQNVLEYVYTHKPDVVIVNDTGSSEGDYVILTKLKTLCKEVIVCDHHIPSYLKEVYSKVGISYFNPHTEGITTLMCGAYVAYECVKNLTNTSGENLSTSVAACYALIGQYADVIDCSTVHHKQLYNCAMERLSLPVTLDLMLGNKQVLCRRSISFTIAPKINALFRAENFKLLNEYFVEDTPTETLLHLLEEIKNFHNKTREVIRDCTSYIIDNGLVEVREHVVYCNITHLLSVNKIMSPSFIINCKGLIAGGLSRHYGKHAICFVNDGLQYQGSFRVADTSTRNFKDLFTDFDSGGHAGAFGFYIKPDKLYDFYDKIEELNELCKTEDSDDVELNVYHPIAPGLEDYKTMLKYARENEFHYPGSSPLHLFRGTVRIHNSSHKYGHVYLLKPKGYVDGVWLASEKPLVNTVVSEPIVIYPYINSRLKLEVM